MRLARPVLFAIILAAGFFYFTTHRSGTFHTADWLSRPATRRDHRGRQR